MMSKPLDPFSYWANTMQLALLTAEAQSVIAMRIWGMAGIWSVTPSENQKMVTEKVRAMTQAYGSVASATMRGAGPEECLAAAIKPFRQKTRSNSRRLAKRGLKRS